MIPRMQPCPTCHGEGIVPHQRRRLPNGEPDKFDIVDWPSTICDACGGSGQVEITETPAHASAPNH